VDLAKPRSGGSFPPRQGPPRRVGRVGASGRLSRAAGEWPSGKAADSGSANQRFESSLPSQRTAVRESLSRFHFPGEGRRWSAWTSLLAAATSRGRISSSFCADLSTSLNKNSRETDETARRKHQTGCCKGRCSRSASTRAAAHRTYLCSCSYELDDLGKAAPTVPGVPIPQRPSQPSNGCLLPRVASKRRHNDAMRTSCQPPLVCTMTGQRRRPPENVMAEKRTSEAGLDLRHAELSP
jgi:hypothetical protein